MKTFCYHVRNVNGRRIFGGMIHAESMEDAAQRVIKQMKIVPIKHIYDYALPAQWWLVWEGKKINLYLSVHPENL